MNYIELLKESARKSGSIVCLGLDPIVEEIPESGMPGEAILRFYENILNKIISRGIFPGAAKPNFAFYSRYGFEGLKSMLKIIGLYREAGIPVILDVKRGDIGKTAEAYADESFGFYGADAVTLSPYMGFDSVEPFMTKYPGKGYYVLTKTSNSSSGEIQDISCGKSKLYGYVAEKIIDWYAPGIGSVVGATYPGQLAEISEVFTASGREIPLLIPGVGTQGGSLAEVMKALKACPDFTIHRINSSSAINYAYKKKPGMGYAEAAVEALDFLNTEIGGYA